MTVIQACQLLEVSRSGYYARVAAHKQHLAAPVVCAASARLKAAFADSHKAYGKWQPETANRYGRTRSGRGQAPDTDFDAN